MVAWERPGSGGRELKRADGLQAQGRVRRRGGWTRMGLTLACRQGMGCWAWGERPGKVDLASPVPSPSSPSARPVRMALRSPDNTAPLMVELTSQITARDRCGATWRNRVCRRGRGRQGPS